MTDVFLVRGGIAVDRLELSRVPGGESKVADSSTVVAAVLVVVASVGAIDVSPTSERGGEELEDEPVLKPSTEEVANR